MRRAEQQPLDIRVGDDRGFRARLERGDALAERGEQAAADHDVVGACPERDAPLGSIDRAKLNPKGSSVALGHPFAATGARIVATLAKELAERGSGRGLISICAAGGMGVTAILER